MSIRGLIDFLARFKVKSKRKETISSIDQEISLESLEERMLKGEYDAVLNEIEEIKLQDLTSFDDLRLDVVKSECFLKKSEYQKTLDLTQQIVAKCQETQRHDKILVDAIIPMIDVLNRLGRVDEAFELINQHEQILNILSEDSPLETKFREAALIYHKGRVYYYKGDYEQALEYILSSLALRKELNNNPEITNSLLELKNNLESGVCLNMLGVIYWYQGNLDNALDYYQQSLEMVEKIGNKLLITRALNNIGEVYKIKGELDLALEYHQKNLTVFEELKNKQDTINCLTNIGIIHYEKGDLDQSTLHLKRSLSLSEGIANNLTMSEMLFYLISVAIEKSDLEQAHQHLDRLKGINNQEADNKRISQRYRVAEALLLKTSKRARNRAKAEEIFEQIIEEEVIEHEMTAFALLNLCDLLLVELRTTGDESALREVKQLVSRLLEIAKEKQSHSLLAETAWLQSQLALIELEIEEAKRLLTQAQLLAEEKGLIRLAMTISKEHDILLEQTNLWEDFTKRAAPFAERMAVTHLEEQLVRMIKTKSIKDIELVEEEPVYFMILSEGGISLYSRSFQPDFNIDSLLVGGFLTAIQEVGIKLFSQTLDRVKIGKYTLIFDSKSPFRLCYVFKGESYPAMQKMKKLEKYLADNQSVKQDLIKLSESSSEVVGRTKEELNNTILEIFL
ncbi:MAG: tetratricopeptide repeat protein [Candidatus Hodarchaeota archaeon]